MTVLCLVLFFASVIKASYLSITKVHMSVDEMPCSSEPEHLCVLVTVRG